MIPCVLHEDEHLLAVNKPAGMNTHAPGPFAGEGIYDWLRHREPRWAGLSIIHRLDKDTSGVIVFGKTPLANRSLTAQFSERRARKQYVLLTDRPFERRELKVISALVRAGDQYVSRPAHAGGEQAETRFRFIRSTGGRALIQAEPVTGRTHQIRVHAAANGFPVLGDRLYGGTPGERLCLHAAELTLRHPATERSLTLSAPVDFEADARLALRLAIIEPVLTDAYRLVHGAADGWPGWYVDRLGAVLFSQAEAPWTPGQLEALKDWRQSFPSRAVYHKTLARPTSRRVATEATPQRIVGDEAGREFVVRENGVRFALRFAEGASAGLFLDQRDNRRRLLENHVAAGFTLFPSGPAGASVLNTFAYTCGFSVCAAKAGARVTSLDLSQKYLDWGRHNFVLNGLDPSAHDFIYGDVQGWLRRLAKQGRRFDLVALDPPTFSRSKEHGVFQAGKHYGELVAAALPLLRANGVIFASTNAAKLEPERFLGLIRGALEGAQRRIAQLHYAPQPPDFPVHRAEPAYLKTLWARIP